MSYFLLGPIKIHYYGLTAALGFLAGLMLTRFLARKFNVSQEKIDNISLWLIIFGLLGTRFYHILNAWNYYFKHPANMLYIWQGGLAIHGGLATGFLVLIFFVKKYKINFWRLADIFLPALVLGYSIGRWGNFFNQELFGQPTNLPWKIFIDLAHRPVGYENFAYFHPVFLYEFIWGTLIVSSLLLYLSWKVKIKKQQMQISGLIAGAVLFLWTLGRFLVEFLRIDPVPMIFAVRLPLLVSLCLMTGGAGIFVYQMRQRIS